MADKHFELWRIWVAIKHLCRTVYYLPCALLFESGLKAYGHADVVFRLADGRWHLEWLRDGLILRGTRWGVIQAIAIENWHTNWWVMQNAVRRLQDELRRGNLLAGNDSDTRRFNS